MHSEDYLSGSDRKFLEQTTTCIDYIDAGGVARFNLPADVYNNVKSLHDDFAAKLKLVEEPATRTSLTVAAKNTARKAFEPAYRGMVKEYLTYNHLVTDEDRRGMGLPIHKTTHTDAPVATKAPDFDVDTSVIGRVGINFYEKEAGHRKAKPAGQHCVEFAWVLADTPPTRWEELIHSAVDTRSPYTFVFENDQRGKTLYFALRWENTRGEKGPWSEIASAIIP